MNFPILLARLLMVTYCAFLLLFAAGEGIAEEGFGHLIFPLAIILVLAFLGNRPLLSGIALLFLFATTVWFFNTYSGWLIFLIVSAPLAVSGVLFIFGSRLEPGNRIKLW